MFEPLNKLIKKKERANPGVLFSTQVCFQAEEIIKKLLPEVKDRFKIVSFKDGRLKLAAKDSITLYQIKMQEEEIAKEIRKKLSIKKFKIYFSPANN